MFYHEHHRLHHRHNPAVFLTSFVNDKLKHTPPPAVFPHARLPYEARAKLAANPLGARCLEIMARKQTNLSVAADVDTAEEMLLLADQVSEG